MSTETKAEQTDKSKKRKEPSSKDKEEDKIVKIRKLGGGKIKVKVAFECEEEVTFDEKSPFNHLFENYLNDSLKAAIKRFKDGEHMVCEHNWVEMSPSEYVELQHHECGKCGAIDVVN
jgi:hypothetical protein